MTQSKYEINVSIGELQDSFAFDHPTSYQSSGAGEETLSFTLALHDFASLPGLERLTPLAREAFLSEAQRLLQNYLEHPDVFGERYASAILEKRDQEPVDLPAVHPLLDTSFPVWNHLRDAERAQRRAISGTAADLQTRIEGGTQLSGPQEATFISDGKQVEFSINGGNPIAQLDSVTIAGAPLAPEEYSVNCAQGTITLRQSAPYGHTLALTYRFLAPILIRKTPERVHQHPLVGEAPPVPDDADVSPLTSFTHAQIREIRNLVAAEVTHQLHQWEQGFGRRIGSATRIKR